MINENSEDESMVADHSNVNISRRRSTLRGSALIPPTGLVTASFAVKKDERKEMYMQLLQGKIEDVRAIKHLQRQVIEDHNEFLRQYL